MARIVVLSDIHLSPTHGFFWENWCVAHEFADAITQAVTGLPAEALLEAAADADMLVVGSRGAGGFKRLLMGSVSTQVTHHAHCPVVVIHAENA